jgi:hypothetical protein
MGRNLTILLVTLILLGSLGGSVQASDNRIDGTCHTLLETFEKIEELLAEGGEPRDPIEIVEGLEIPKLEMSTQNIVDQLLPLINDWNPCEDPGPIEACDHLRPTLREVRTNHRPYAYPTSSPPGGAPSIFGQVEDQTEWIIEEFLASDDEVMVLCGESIHWDLCGYIALPCDLILEAQSLIEGQLMEVFGLFNSAQPLIRGSEEDAAKQAGQDPDGMPWLEHQCRTARTETAGEGSAGGEWRIVIPTESIKATPEQAYSESNAGQGAFKSFGRLSLDFPDNGMIEQNICYDPGNWSPVVPPTELPPSEGDYNQAAGLCAAGAGAMAVAAGVAIGGALTLPAGAPFLIGGGMAFLGLGIVTLIHCTDYASLQVDKGYMNCRGYASVSWGGGGGNRYHSTILNVGVLEITSESKGGGYKEVRFPSNVQEQVLYDGPDYHKGMGVCDRTLNDYRKAAYAEYLKWGETDSDPGAVIGESATAALSARLDVQTVPIEEIPATWNQFSEGTFLDPVGDAFWFGCERANCVLEVEVRLNSCGRQVLSPGLEAVTYKFIGAPDCLELELRVNGNSVSAGLPVLRLDGTFGGGGRNPLI